MGTSLLKPREGLTDEDVAAFLAGRKEAGKLIDPENCEIFWTYAETFDAYGLFVVPPDMQQVGREYFARSLPDGEWVEYSDIPRETVAAIQRRIKAGAFDVWGVPYPVETTETITAKRKRIEEIAGVPLADLCLKASFMKEAAALDIRSEWKDRHPETSFSDIELALIYHEHFPQLSEDQCVACGLTRLYPGPGFPALRKIEFV